MSTLNPPTPRPAQILVVDDEPDLRTLYELTLLREGYRVEAAGSVSEAWQHLEAGRFDAVITDMRLPDGLGMEILQRIQQDQRGERCVVMTAYGSAENAVEALKAGAFDYLTKPVDLKQFRAVVASAVQATLPGHAEGGRAIDEPARRRHRRSAAAASPRSNGWWANRSRCASSRRASPRWRAAWRRCWCAANRAPARNWSRAPCMRAASAATARSSRSIAAPFPRTCSKRSSSARARAPTPAPSQDRDGYFQAARGGTLFLDEIGDLPLAMQSKLLRAIQERSVRPIGSTQEDAVDVRIVSATHKDLHAEVQASRFRQDLFYRLNVIEIAVPAVARAARATCPRCAMHCSRASRATPACRCPTLSADVLQRLSEHPLRGNVRELENLLHRAVALSDGDDAASRFRRHLGDAAGSPIASPSVLARTRPRLHSRRASPTRPARRCRATCRAISTSRNARSSSVPCRKAASIARRRRPPRPEPAPDPLSHRAPGHRHAERRRRQWLRCR